MPFVETLLKSPFLCSIKLNISFFLRYLGKPNQALLSFIWKGRYF